MAGDGLLFKQLSWVSRQTQVPALSVIISSTFAAIFAFLISLHDLVELLSMGHLQANIFLAIGVLILRYSSEDLLANNDDAVTSRQSWLFQFFFSSCRKQFFFEKKLVFGKYHLNNFKLRLTKILNTLKIQMKQKHLRKKWKCLYCRHILANP